MGIFDKIFRKEGNSEQSKKEKLQEFLSGDFMNDHFSMVEIKKREELVPGKSVFKQNIIFFNFPIGSE